MTGQFEEADADRGNESVQASSRPVVEAGVEGLLESYGVAGRRLVGAIDLLSGPALTLTDLIRKSGLPRRTVERLLLSLDQDVLRTSGGRLQLRQAAGTSPNSLALSHRNARAAGPQDDLPSIDFVRRIVRGAPKAKKNLDHVSATPETVIRRARHIQNTFMLDGRRMVFVGDHDLTSIAVATLVPSADLTVVDIDEDLLEYISVVAAEYKLRIRCLYADLTTSMPASTVGVSDLVFTDPPYTPDGVSVFLCRAVSTLVRTRQTRILMAYGFSDTHPSLGLNVQKELGNLDLAIESILPSFNQYDGAEALGCRSDLYTLQPTAKTWSKAERGLQRGLHAIYTHGDRSIEKGERGASVGLGPLFDIAEYPAQGYEEARHWPCAVAADVRDRVPERRTLSALLSGDVGRPGDDVFANLLNGHETWLARSLIASAADRLLLLVPNGHPDISNQDGQRQLADLIDGKYNIRFLRSRPNANLAVADAARCASNASTNRGRSALLKRPTATLRSSLSDAIYKESRGPTLRALTKDEARGFADRILMHVGQLYGDVSLLSLPRHFLAKVQSELDRCFEELVSGPNPKQSTANE